MAAIWGILSHSESNIQPELSVSMKKRMGKYKIDRIDDLLSDKFYFACGHQYFTPEAVHEILPYHDKERNIFFYCRLYFGQPSGTYARTSYYRC